MSGAVSEAAWGSEAIANVVRATGVAHIALTPGASYRGLHDSLVNHLGNERPRIVLCLHEEHAVAIAHGYAKVTGEPMAVALHSNVGLMHATMAIYNAFCDRVPMLVLGATALWTAAALQLPLLVVVANNGSYLNDEVHQERVDLDWLLAEAVAGAQHGPVVVDVRVVAESYSVGASSQRPQAVAG